MAEERKPICDVCDREMVPFGGTWICPVGAEKLTPEDEALVNEVLGR